jgi:hypothetical protein
MLEIIELLIHFGTTVFKLLKPGGVKVVMAETIAMKQQLIVMNRSRKRSPTLRYPRSVFVWLINDVDRSVSPSKGCRHP